MPGLTGANTGDGRIAGSEQPLLGFRAIPRTPQRDLSADNQPPQAPGAPQQRPGAIHIVGQRNLLPAGIQSDTSRDLPEGGSQKRRRGNPREQYSNSGSSLSQADGSSSNASTTLQVLNTGELNNAIRANKVNTNAVIRANKAYIKEAMSELRNYNADCTKYLIQKLGEHIDQQLDEKVKEVHTHLDSEHEKSVHNFSVLKTGVIHSVQWLADQFQAGVGSGTGNANVSVMLRKGFKSRLHCLRLH